MNLNVLKIFFEVFGVSMTWKEMYRTYNFLRNDVNIYESFGGR
jgi:hypothetical protein